MMRRFLLLVLCCLLLTGCTKDPIAPLAADNPVEAPAPALAEMPVAQHQAVLWFRYGDEPMLASELRTLSATASENDALAILRALIHGPAAASTELRGLFPTGTQVISATQTDRVMFVTLSRHIMNGYPDEPAAWRDQAVWASEVPLRRQLAMQAIAATVTENFPVDTVVILVDQSATDSLRLRNAYYTLDNDKGIAPYLTRDERYLLTPSRTAEIIMECWQSSDWARLYRYVARTDPTTGQARPEEAAFVNLMLAQPHLLSASVSGGSIQPQGATFTLQGEFLIDGEVRAFHSMILRLTQEKGLWRVGLSQLTGREASP